MISFTCSTPFEANESLVLLRDIARMSFFVTISDDRFKSLGEEEDEDGRAMSPFVIDMAESGDCRGVFVMGINRYSFRNKLSFVHRLFALFICSTCGEKEHKLETLNVCNCITYQKAPREHARFAKNNYIQVIRRIHGISQCTRVQITIRPIDIEILYKNK